MVRAHAFEMRRLRQFASIAVWGTPDPLCEWSDTLADELPVIAPGGSSVVISAALLDVGDRSCVSEPLVLGSVHPGSVNEASLSDSRRSSCSSSAQSTLRTEDAERTLADYSLDVSALQWFRQATSLRQPSRFCEDMETDGRMKPFCRHEAFRLWPAEVGFGIPAHPVLCSYCLRQCQILLREL